MVIAKIRKNSKNEIRRRIGTKKKIVNVSFPSNKNL
jgi:hypothetical protein